MTISFWQEALLKKLPSSSSTSFDFTIIGAGIAGISIAYWLEKNHPTAKIAIIEQNDYASGASGKNAGFVTCGSAEHFDKLNHQFGLNKAKEIWIFSEQNRELLKQEIILESANEIDFKITGSCTVCPNENQVERYQRILQQMLSVGIDAESLSANDLKQLYSVKKSYGGIQYKLDGQVHPIKLINLMISKLKNTSFFLNEKSHSN